MDDEEISATDCDDFDVLLVSDASGQMEPVHRQGNRTLAVMGRTFSIFQFQLRRKMLKLLRLWQRNDSSSREFAFVHLFLNLKDRSNTPRVPSEYIPALGGIRTDLDQFSFIEREVLMYHGYTLIDAQIQKYCERLKTFIGNGTNGVPELAQPPLFLDQPPDPAAEQCVSETKLRKRVKDVLKAGSGRVFLCRSWRKYRLKSSGIFGPALLLLLDGWGWGVGAVQNFLKLFRAFNSQIERWLSFAMPDWLQWVLEKVLENCSFPLDTQVLTDVVWILLWFYVVAFLTYVAMRRMLKRWDIKDYQTLTDKDYTIHWTANDASSEDRR